MKYGDLYRQALERARKEALGKEEKHDRKRTSGNLDALDRLKVMVDELRSAGAPVILKDILEGPLDEQSLMLVIGDSELPVSIDHMAVNVFWRGLDKTPMVYHSLSLSRMNALAKAIVHRAVPKALSKEEKRSTTPARVIRLP
ncbi:MAG: hypothetical protein ABW205_05410 [Burkholderiales bacterium]|jgi:hypothetical protein